MVNDFSGLIDLTDRDHQLAVKFWAVFGRFEYALKRSGYAKAGKSKEAQANWDLFAAHLQQHWIPHRTEYLRQAEEYFDQQPPRKQVLAGIGLKFIESNPDQAAPVDRILILVRRVRNNLLHGGKFPTAPAIDPTRDVVLIGYALVFLDECLTLCARHIPELYRHFTEPQTP